MLLPVYRGLFYDALSGEFEPRTDPENRRHTLARLSYAAHSKGDFVDSPRVPDRLLRQISPAGISLVMYSPSWAPEVSVGVFSDINSVRSLEMGLGDSRFGVYDIDFEGDQAVRVCSTLPKREDKIIPLGLGPRLDVARQYIAITAQNFFNQVHPTNDFR